MTELKDQIWNCLAQPVIDGNDYYRMITVNHLGVLNTISFGGGGEYFSIGQMIIATCYFVPEIKRMYFTIDMHPDTVTHLIEDQIKDWEEIMEESYPFEIWIQRPMPSYDAQHHKDTAFKKKILNRK